MEQNKAFVEAIINRMKTVLGVDSDADVAKLLGGSRSQLSIWKTRGKIPFQQCISLATEHGISLDWLVLGRGSMKVDSDDPEAQAATQYIEVPQYDIATMMTADESVQPWALQRTWLEQEGLIEAGTIVVKVAGDAMAPTIYDGQLVIVDCRTKDTDGVYLVRSGDAVRVRRVQRMIDGSVRLLCDNPAYETETISAADVRSLHLTGYCHAAIALLR